MRFIIFILFGSLSCLLGCDGRKENSKNSEKMLRVAISQDPESIDPRKIRTVTAVGVSHMLYEGLMRFDAQGKVVPALAEKVEISKDKKTYTFTLNQSYWSNGDPITASDFAETYKSTLKPDFPAPNAYQLYVLKGAKLAKLGLQSPQEIGVMAKDEKTLVFELAESCPFFLSLAATHFMYPVHKSLREGGSVHATPITNGPFQVDNWQRSHRLTLKKNPNFWDSQSVPLENVSLQILDESTAYQMFKKNELEWTGSPLLAMPIDTLKSLMDSKKLSMAPALGSFWVRLNTKSPVFTSKNMRRAFGLSIDRKSLVEHVVYVGEPATGIVPKKMGLNPNPLFQDHDVAEAKNFYKKALDEDCVSPKDLKKITLCYLQSDKNHRIAQVLREDWKKNLHLEVLLQAIEPKLFYERLAKGDFDISLGGWVADIPDPINFLEIFKFKENTTNSTGWEMEEYQSLLDRSNQADKRERYELLSKAETLLIDEMPIIPLYHGVFGYLQNPNVQNVGVSDLGFMEIRNARVSQ
ncbi:peptide ABC transporter substrate-binding protein [Criblamydia sequanensis]|uniref:ABC-type transporter, substrate-binding protein n=1 Tax=Candidatus Criblamydia sequanensis CRIB-18 TaxID=1437425 RepID=A0A090DXX3_9BACT|nr:peptide ABC transporter substrate-binding protein [Criblamydia sequanensis]CDR33624.1 ABC-type transporter, substrate-binding protein [Criblamydia sequanensis CRIB-18]